MKTKTTTMWRMWSTLALAAIVATGLAMPVAAQDYDHDRDHNGQYDRDHNGQYDRDHNGQYDHDHGYRRESLGRNRYRYSYNGQNFDYTVDNRRGDLDSREVAQRGQQSGYNQGVQDGQYDTGSRRTRPNPASHGAYQFGLDGWDPNWGSGATYQRAYRQGYVHGFNEAVSRNRRPY